MMIDADDNDGGVVVQLTCLTYLDFALCGLQSCKNRQAPFLGRMSYNATKSGLVCLSYLNMLYYCIKHKHKRSTMGIRLRPLCPHLTL